VINFSAHSGIEPELNRLRGGWAYSFRPASNIFTIVSLVWYKLLPVIWQPLFVKSASPTLSYQFLVFAMGEWAVMYSLQVCSLSKTAITVSPLISNLKILAIVEVLIVEVVIVFVFVE